MNYSRLFDFRRFICTVATRKELKRVSVTDVVGKENCCEGSERKTGKRKLQA